MSISTFDSTMKGRSTCFDPADKKHNMSDPTDIKKGQKNAKLAGRKEKTIQLNALE